MPDNGKIMFGQTLHDNPSDPWQEVLADGDKNGELLSMQTKQAGFDPSFKFYIRPKRRRHSHFNACFRFIIALDVTKHIRRIIRTLF